MDFCMKLTLTEVRSYATDHQEHEEKSEVHLHALPDWDGSSWTFWKLFVHFKQLRKISALSLGH